MRTAAPAKPGPSVPLGGSPSLVPTGGAPVSPTGMPEGSAFAAGAPKIKVPRAPRVAKVAKPKDKIIPDLTPEEIKAISDAHPNLEKALSTAKQVQEKIVGPKPAVTKVPPSGTVRMVTEGAGGTRREVGSEAITHGDIVEFESGGKKVTGVVKKPGERAGRIAVKQGYNTVTMPVENARKVGRFKFPTGQ